VRLLANASQADSGNPGPAAHIALAPTLVIRDSTRAS